MSLISITFLEKNVYSLGMTGEKKKESAALRGRLISFASNFIAAMLVLSFAGYQLDKYLENDNHVFFLTGIFLGFAWSMYETFKLTKLLNQSKKSDNSDSK